MRKLRREVQAFWCEEAGVGVIEVVLMDSIFSEINKQSKEVY